MSKSRVAGDHGEIRPRWTAGPFGLGEACRPVFCGLSQRKAGFGDSGHESPLRTHVVLCLVDSTRPDSSGIHIVGGKGVVDAVDGELARMRGRPSHVGRYWDTIADAIGLVVVMFALGTTLEWGHALTIGMILAVLLQYSLFNHFSLRLRILGSGDTTSRLDERTCPQAYPWEKQKSVERLHSIYLLLFSWQDRIVTALAGQGKKELRIEFTSSSILGFGFQSLILASIAIVGRIDLLPEIVLFANNAIFAFAVLCSRLGATASR